MKKVVIAVVLLVSSLSFAQEVKPKLEVVDQMVKATYYYDNGLNLTFSFLNLGYMKVQY